MALIVLMASLVFLQFAATTTNDTDMGNCTVVNQFSYDGGNMTCPNTAPVLSYIQTSAPLGPLQQYTPTTNWTMSCDCPLWSVEASNAESYWRPFSDNFRRNASGHFDCGLTHYLSGLAYQFHDNGVEDAYHWWGRCTKYHPGYATNGLHCWKADTILSQGSNKQISLPNPRVIIRRLDIDYPLGSTALNDIYTTWSYSLCLISPVECTVPGIENGFTELAPTSSDVYTGLPAKVKSNETVKIYCSEGHYMEGPNVSQCLTSGEWTPLPTCKACKSIRYCKVLECSDRRLSYCTQCRPYTSIGLRVALNHNRKKCRTVPYINQTQTSSDIFVYESGDTIVMDCPANGKPAPSIQWFIFSQDNISVSDVINSARLRSFKNGSLKIRNLTTEDEGVYSCTAVNSVGYDWMYVYLVHYYSNRFHRPRESPRILNQTDIPLFFTRNKQVFLHCKTTGSPPPRIRWSKRDAYVQYYLPLVGNLRTHIYDNGSLGFHPIHFEDAGVYACEAVNDYGGDVATWIVCVGDSCGGEPSAGGVIPPLQNLIAYRPFIIKWTHVYFVVVGESLSLSCVAGGNPIPTFLWRRNDNIVSEGRLLSISNAALYDTGVYECVARNSVGEDKRKVAVIVQDLSAAPPVTTTLSISISISSAVSTLLHVSKLRTMSVVIITVSLSLLQCHPS